MAADVLQLFSYLLANVSDFNSALRLPCYSCMSPYLEFQYPDMGHLYRRPLAFDQHCDRRSFDRSYLPMKNCSDMCVTIRMYDVVGGRRRTGYMRGCLSDIQGYNHSLIRVLPDHHGCIETTYRELFMPTATRQDLEPQRVALCGCHQNNCNHGHRSSSLLSSVLAVVLLLPYLR